MMQWMIMTRQESDSEKENEDDHNTDDDNNEEEETHNAHNSQPAKMTEGNLAEATDFLTTMAQQHSLDKEKGNGNTSNTLTVPLVDELRGIMVKVGDDVRVIRAALGSEIKAIAAEVDGERHVREKLQKEVSVVKKGTVDINKRLEKVTKSVQELGKEVIALRNEKASLKDQVAELNEGLDSLTDTVNENDDRSRRRNLIIRGISEKDERGRQDTEDRVRWFLKDCLNIEADLERARHIGPRIEGRARLIVVEFTSVRQRDKVYARKSEVRFNSNARRIFIEGDFCQVTRQIRFKLFERQAEMRAKGVNMVVNYRTLEEPKSRDGRGQSRGGRYLNNNSRREQPEEADNTNNNNFNSSSTGAISQPDNTDRGVDEGFTDESAWEAEDQSICEDGMSCLNEDCRRRHVHVNKPPTARGTTSQRSGASSAAKSGSTGTSGTQVSTSSQPTPAQQGIGRGRGRPFDHILTELERFHASGAATGAATKEKGGQVNLNAGAGRASRIADGMNKYFKNHLNQGGIPSMYDPYANGDGDGGRVQNSQSGRGRRGGKSARSSASNYSQTRDGGGRGGRGKPPSGNWY